MLKHAQQRNKGISKKPLFSNEPCDIQVYFLCKELHRFTFSQTVRKSLNRIFQRVPAFVRWTPCAFRGCYIFLGGVVEYSWNDEVLFFALVSHSLTLKCQCSGLFFSFQEWIQNFLRKIFLFQINRSGIFRRTSWIRTVLYQAKLLSPNICYLITCVWKIFLLGRIASFFLDTFWRGNSPYI